MLVCEKFIIFPFGQYINRNVVYCSLLLLYMEEVIWYHVSLCCQVNAKMAWGQCR